ncbi:MAG: monovalent cation/H(+) antiporter subunit G [Clostridiales bacterium]|nr:monovalent cation/H(+) antiporter subunit G [Clostridiales bacterium]
MSNLLVIVFISLGMFFFFVGTIGILRFPDALTRAHSAAKADTLGALLSLTGLVIYNGFDISNIKILMVIIFLWTTNPTATHIIARSIINEKKTAGESNDIV